MKIEGEVLSFPFPVRMLLPLSGGSSHDVTMYSVHTFMLSWYTYASETNAYFLYCSVFNLRNWLHILIFFSATCFFFHSYVWALSILTIECTSLFECIYHLPPLGYLDYFQIFVITGTAGMKFMIMTPYVPWERPSRELLGNRACPLGTRYWAICSSWQL